MTSWQKEQRNKRQKKRNVGYMLVVEKIFLVYQTQKEDIYICSLHFAGENGPTDENPDPIKGMLRRDMDYFLRKCIY